MLGEKIEPVTCQTFAGSNEIIGTRLASVRHPGAAIVRLDRRLMDEINRNAPVQGKEEGGNGVQISLERCDPSSSILEMTRFSPSDGPCHDIVPLFDGPENAFR